jgi:hypothetical protein
MAGNRVEVGSDNNPIISGFPNSGTAGAAFMKYNSSGLVLWQNFDADGVENLLLHGQLQLDSSGNAYLSAGNLFNMAICKVNSNGTNGWVGLVSGSSSASSFKIDTDNSIYVVGGTTAKLAQVPLSSAELNAREFSIYPNPFESEILISLKNDAGAKDIFIYDLTGKLIYSDTFYALNTTLFLNDISKGTYILTIIGNDGKQYSQQIVKK